MMHDFSRSVWAWAMYAFSRTSLFYEGLGDG